MVIVKWFKKKIAEREEQIWREDKAYRDGMARRQAERKAQLEKEAKEKEAKEVFQRAVIEDARKHRRNQRARGQAQTQTQTQTQTSYYDSLQHQIHTHLTHDVPTPKEDDKERHYKAVHGSSFGDNHQREVEIRDTVTESFSSYGGGGSSSYDSGGSSSYSSSSYDSGGSSSSYDSGGGGGGFD